MTIDPALLAFLAAVFGSSVSIISTLILNRHTRLQQEAQWAREERRADQAEAKAEREKKITETEAAKSALLDQYSEVNAGLAKISAQLVHMSIKDNTEFLDIIGTTEKRLAVMLATFPEKGLPEYLELERLCIQDKDGLWSAENLKRVKTLVYGLSSKDSRFAIR